MATFVQDGRYVDYTPASAVAAGAVVVQVDLVGVAVRDIPANTLGVLAVEGQFGTGGLVELRDDCVAHAPVAVAQVAGPQATHTVEHLVAVDVPHPAAFAAGDDVRPPALSLHRPGVGHGVPEVLGVVALQFGRVHVES